MLHFWWISLFLVMIAEKDLPNTSLTKALQKSALVYDVIDPLRFMSANRARTLWVACQTWSSVTLISSPGHT